METAGQNGQDKVLELGRPDGRGRSPGSRRTQFAPGASGNPGGVPRADESPVPEPDDEVGDGAPGALKDLRWVRRNIGVRCRGTPIQEALRREARKNPLKFNAEHSRLEREFLATGGKSAAGGDGGRSPGVEPDALPPDAGEVRVEALIKELLAEAAGGERCPTCGR